MLRLLEGRFDIESITMERTDRRVRRSLPEYAGEILLLDQKRHDLPFDDDWIHLVAMSILNGILPNLSRSVL